MMFKTKPENKPMSDREAKRVVSDEKARRDTLAEAERRLQAKADAEEAKKQADAAKATKAKVTAFVRLTASTCAEVLREHDALTVPIEESAAALERRDAVLARLHGLHEELRRLGAPVPPFAVPAFSPAVIKAAHRILPTLLAETGLDSPYLGTVAAQVAFRR